MIDGKCMICDEPSDDLIRVEIESKEVKGKIIPVNINGKEIEKSEREVIA